MRDKVDLLVVGSGAAGSVFAAEASAAGKQVVLLEAGPARPPGDLVSSQLWARRQKWGGAHVEEEGDHRVGHNFNAGWGTGGSTMHHYGVWPRLHENDFRTFTEYGRGLDWPFQYAELRPY
ncbi:MAG: NAD(P)-binding protein, partial [Haliea sp.]